MTPTKSRSANVPDGSSSGPRDNFAAAASKAPAPAATCAHPTCIPRAIYDGANRCSAPLGCVCGPHGLDPDEKTARRRRKLRWPLLLPTPTDAVESRRLRAQCTRHGRGTETSIASRDRTSTSSSQERGTTLWNFEARRVRNRHRKQTPATTKRRRSTDIPPRAPTNAQTPPPLAQSGSLDESSWGQCSVNVPRSIAWLVRHFLGGANTRARNSDWSTMTSVNIEERWHRVIMGESTRHNDPGCSFHLRGALPPSPSQHRRASNPPCQMRTHPAPAALQTSSEWTMDLLSSSLGGRARQAHTVRWTSRRRWSHELCNLSRHHCVKKDRLTSRHNTMPAREINR